MNTGAAGLLLTGGASRRFGSDKGRALHGGRPLSEIAAYALRAATDVAVEVGTGMSSLPCVREEPPGTGPLAAVTAGWNELRGRGEWAKVVVLACDLPRVNGEFVRWLAARTDATSVVPVSGGRPQPLCACFTAAALDTAATLLGAGKRSMSALLDTIDVDLVEPAAWAGVAPADVVDDVDVPEDLDRLQQPSPPRRGQ